MVLISSALQLMVAVLAAYWMSIALSQKDGPYDAIRIARGKLPILENTELVATILATAMVILQMLVPMSGIALSPFAFAGALVFFANFFGIKDYE